MPISDEIRATLLERDPGRAIARALDTLLERDRHLFEVDANERSLTHRFGMYLQAQFEDWDVDCEYNRRGADPKRYVTGEWLVEVTNTDGKTAYPDVIVHRRGTDRNHLVLEFKKSTSQQGDGDDLRKLIAYKSDQRLSYEFAIFIELQVGDQPGVSRAQWID